jgi:hypothetical protein
MKKKGNSSVTRKKDAARFRKAALAYAKKATESEENAQKTLVKLGIYTSKGNLTSKYSK